MARWNVICLLITAIALTVSGSEAVTWHQGCYDLDLDPIDPPAPGVSGLDPAGCCGACRIRRSRYAALVEGQSCQCLNTLPVRPLVNEACNISCGSVGLSCGGSQKVSVYATAGPYLVNVTSHVMEPMNYVRDPITVKSILLFAGPPNITTGVAHLEGKLNKVIVTCESGETVISNQLAAFRTRVRSDCSFNFTSPGIFHIDIRARTSVSLVTTSVNVTVLLRVPRDLQLSLVTPVQDLPSCLPRNSTKADNVKTVAAFANEPVHFEASLSVGENLTFVWILDEDQNRARIVPIPADCVDRECTTSRQEYVFTDKGRHTVRVTVRSDLGSLKDDLEVIVVARELSHVNFSCQAPASMVMTPLSTARFMVTMVTTDRQNTTLELDYGDGTKASYLIVDHRGRFLGIPQIGDLSDQVVLAADYGKGCTLRLEVDHVYRAEGVYIPHIHVHNNHSEASLGLDQPITVEETLQGLTIQGPANVAVGQKVTFVAEFSVRSQIINFKWTIKINNTIIYNDTSTTHSLTYVFPRRGMYSVSVEAENHLSAKNKTNVVKVLQPISDLQLTLLNGSRSCIRTGEDVSFTVSIATGSGAIFEWDFSDEEVNTTTIIDNSMSSLSTHTFNKPGLYTIRVEAFNDVSSSVAQLKHPITVEDPVETLQVETSSPTLLGNETIIKAEVTEGTGVKFMVEYNQTKVQLNSTDLLKVTCRWTFDLGEHIVKVIAYNNVSRVERVVEVEVQDKVDEVAVTISADTVKGEKVIFEALLGIQNVLSDRRDLIYRWSIDGTVVAITRCPVIVRVFDMVDNYQLAVNVSNKVSSKRSEQKLNVVAHSSMVRFVQRAVWRLGEDTVFRFINLPPRDELRKLQMKPCKVGCHFADLQIEPNVTWRYRYMEPGIYKVDATITQTNDITKVVRTVVVVQETIAGLSLRGPTAIKLYEMSPDAEWRASLENGTHEIYTWAVERRSVITTSSKFSWKFQQAGLYNISVNVSNSLGWEVVSSEIMAEYPIVRLELKVLPCLLGDVSPITLTVHGGPMRLVTISFGDGTARTLEEGDPLLGREEKMGEATGQHGPTTKYTINHIFEKLGHYVVSVNASNRVSSMGASVGAMVHEPITGVTVTSEFPRIIRRGTTVEVIATVAMGMNLTFDWYFSDDGNPTFSTNGNVSIATHVLEEVGQVSVTVYVSGLHSTVGAIAHLPFNFTVESPIEDVSIYERNQRNWAAFELQSDGHTWSSVPVFFIAQASKGSNIVFVFDFGDGTTETVQRVISLSNGILEAEVSHIYSKVGTYAVTVTASNLLGHVSSTSLHIHVQVPPAGLHLLDLRQFYKVTRGNVTTFSANISQGTDINYDWDMGDLTEYKKAGAVVSHQYKWVGTFALGVKVYNKVASQFVEAEVQVTQAILGVNISVIDGNRHPTETQVHFKAIPYPEHAGVEHYVWDFGERDGLELEVKSNVVQHRYTSFGTFTVHVKAFNAVGHKMSLPRQVEIVEPLTPVQLVIKGQTLIGQLIRMEAYHYEGSNVIYTWNFGDGQSRSSTSSVVRHIYQREGQYIISVTAVNPFGNKTDSKSVFVLAKPCSPPDILFHGEQWAVISRTQDIKLEAEVRTNCSLTSSANYTWSIRNSHTHREVYVREFLHDPILYLPRRTLHYANYTVTLRVDMQGTIVYSTKETNFKVVPTPLVAVISGGLQRKVSRKEKIILNGSASHDPDFPETRAFRYRWGCYQLLKRELPCFVVDTVLPRNNVTASLAIAGHDFVPNVTDFVFNLTVWRPGRLSSNTTQVLQIEDIGIIDVAVVCTECEDTIVNSDQRLVLLAEQTEYQESELTYSWDLAVHQSDHTPASAHDNNECVKADGSSYLNLRANSNSTSNETGASPLNTSKGQGNGLATGQNGTTPVTASAAKTRLINGTTTSTPRGRHGDRRFDVSEGAPEGGRPPGGPPAAERPHPPLLDGIKEGPGDIDGTGQGGHSGGRPESGSASGRRGQPQDPSPTPPAHNAGRQLHTSDSPIEARGSGRGSGSGIASDGRRPEDAGRETNGSQGGSAEKAIDKTQQTRSNPHIVNIIRTPVNIDPEHTTTGTHQRALVIKQGFLKQGRTYIIRVSITHKVTKLTGAAMAYVKVNESPSLGACSLKPDNGVEMTTMFRVVCMEWWDDNTPTGIRYEVSYSLNEGRRTQDLVYQGLHHQINFQLPAGNPDQDNIVNVTISILDKYNARTTVCNQPVKVLPHTFGTTNQTEVEAIYELVGEENSTLQTYISKGDNRNIRLHTQLVAHKLNRLKQQGHGAQTSLRAKIRTTMLQTLKDLPMRDEYEVQQTTSAVATSTAVSEELQERSLQYASDILEKATKRVSEISNVTKHVDSSIITVAIQGTSNIMEAASDDVEIHELTSQTAKPVIQKLQRTMQDLLKTELKYTVVGEEPVRRETGYLSTYSGRFKTSEQQHIQAEATTFILPDGLSAIVERSQQLKGRRADNNTASDCCETLMVNYKRNPYTYGKGREVQSQVASLSLFSCQTKAELKVRDLPSHNQVQLTLPTIPSKVEYMGNHTLHKHQMNIHQFNVSLNPKDEQALQILVELQPVPHGRLFPIALLLNADTPPTPRKHQYQRVFPATAQVLSFFLPPHSLNESTVYYLGIVDAQYDAARPRLGEVRVRTYFLRLWHGECVYWNTTEDTWSNVGCSLQHTSNYTTTQCRCNHLTSFGAHFSVVPNNLDFVNIEDFFDLNENPVTFTLVICILGVYLLLLVICIRADNHDERKGAIVHLIDNLPVDRHKYAVTLETGMRRGAGTTAKVSLVLHGEEGMSETRELISESGQPLFERNSRDTFIMTLPDTLGDVWKVQIWHDNAGQSPSWYLSRVIVKDINAGNVFYFSTEKWFAVEEEDGKVEREIMALEGGLGFVKVMWAKGTQYLSDYHIWFSMFTRPSYSRFTRAQRLTCCLSFAVSYMAVNATWYQQMEQEYRGEFGLIDLSWRALAVGCITSVIVLPVNIALVFIFRRSKVKRVCIEDPPEKKQYTTKRDSVSSLDSTMRLLQPVVTPSIFDQSILNWQTLQDWAQRQWSKRYRQHPGDGAHEAVKPANQDAECGRKQEYETDQTSSGFEDCLSHDRAARPGLAADKVPPPAAAPAVPARHLPLTPLPEPHSQRTHKRHSDDSRLQRQQEMQYVLRGVRSRKPHRFFLPHCCLYFGWILATTIILGCSTVTILFGFRFGRTKSIMWLQSLFFSFIQCVFITHPLAVLMMCLYTALKYRSDLSIFDHHDDGIIERHANNTGRKAREPQKDGDEDIHLAEGIATRQRSRYLRFARPPQEKQLLESRKNIMKEKKAMAVVNESVGVVVLLVVLVVIAFSKDLTSPYRLNTALKNTLTKTGNQSFQSVSSVSDWYQWSQTSLLDALYWDTLYNDLPTTHDRMYVGNSAVIGRVNLRQLRVSNEKCRLPDKYNIFPICHHGYSYGNRDQKPFGGNQTWYYQDSRASRSTGIHGNHAHYDGGGYRIVLNTNRLEALHQLQALQHGHWIDDNTRAVVVEFTLYHAPSNLFSSVSLLLELPPGGGTFTMARSMSAYLYKYTTNMDNFVLVCELLLMVVALYKLHCEMGEVARLKKSYVKNPWKSVEVVSLLLMLAYVSCFIYRFMLVHEVIEVLRATYNEQFVDVAYIAYWDGILHSFLGFIILLMSVQALRLLRNRKMFAKFGGVYRKAGLELVYIGVMFVVWTCAYSCLGAALYGAATHNFSRLDLALTTVVGLLTGHNSVKDVELWERLGSQVFLVTFLIFAVGSLTAYVIAVLNFHYKTYQEEGLPSLTFQEALVYFWNRFLRLTGMTRQSTLEEKDESLLPAEFTMAELEYQVDEMLFKMNALTGSSSLPEKPPTYFTDSDCTYGTGDDGISSGGSEGRPFDEDRFEHRLQKIEDNLMAHDPHWAQLLKLEAIGANILSQEREKQVRSALEFEIFRQLQMQRQGDSAELRSLPSDNGHVIIHRLSSLSSNTPSSGSRTSSAQGSPTATASNNKLHKTFSKTSNNASPSLTAHTERIKTPRDSVVPSKALPRSLATTSPSHPTVSDAVILQDISERGSSDPENGIPLQDMGSQAPPAAQSSPKASETRLHDDPVSTSSCSSGGAEIHYIVTQGQTPTEHRSLGSLTTTKGSKTKPKGSTEKTQLSFENLYGDTSSGSELDAALRSTSKARSLRKTRSRGKGKGRSRLTPADGLDLDELGIDNRGYTPETGHDTVTDTATGTKGRHKQCWT